MRGAGRGWGDFLWKIPGGGSPGWVGAEGGRGWEVVCGDFFGGGLNIFFRGRNVHRDHWGNFNSRRFSLVNFGCAVS